MNEIFDFFRAEKNESRYIQQMLRSDDGKGFISDVYESFELKNFESIVSVVSLELTAAILVTRSHVVSRWQVSDSLLAVITMAFNQVIDIEKSNLTSVVSSTQDLVSFLETPRLPDPDWTAFNFSQRWRDAFEETQQQGRLNM